MNTRREKKNAFLSFRLVTTPKGEGGGGMTLLKDDPFPVNFFPYSTNSQEPRFHFRNRHKKVEKRILIFQSHTEYNTEA